MPTSGAVFGGHVRESGRLFFFSTLRRAHYICFVRRQYKVRAMIFVEFVRRASADSYKGISATVLVLQIIPTLARHFVGMLPFRFCRNACMSPLSSYATRHKATYSFPY